MYYHSDGNGNVTMLINPSEYIVAKYLYDAFGNTLSAAGSLAQANLYRFSSKEAHPNSGLVYYLYRYYDPNLQRWPNRDPIDEEGFEVLSFCSSKVVDAVKYLHQKAEDNAYEFVHNQPTVEHDLYGLDHISFCRWLLQQMNQEILNGNVQRGLALYNLYNQICVNPPRTPLWPQVPGTPDPVRFRRFNPQWNCDINPPNMWPYVPPVIIIILTPWPGNPVWGGL
jgi:RHS repeat-associated protein